jgi:hypothetical protein
VCYWWLWRNLGFWTRFSNTRMSTLLGWRSCITSSDLWQGQCLCTAGDHEGWRILFIGFVLTGSWTLISLGWDLRVRVFVERAVARAACCRARSVIPSGQSWWLKLQVILNGTERFCIAVHTSTRGTEYPTAWLLRLSRKRLRKLLCNEMRLWYVLGHLFRMLWKYPHRSRWGYRVSWLQLL